LFMGGKESRGKSRFKAEGGIEGGNLGRMRFTSEKRGSRKLPLACEEEEKKEVGVSVKHEGVTWPIRKIGKIGLLEERRRERLMRDAARHGGSHSLVACSEELGKESKHYGGRPDLRICPQTWKPWRAFTYKGKSISP